jgi:exonuclease VII small subunit
MTTGNDNRRTEPEEDLEQKVESLEREKASLERCLDRALAEIERLRKDLEEALRSLKRQAAPFSKGGSKPKPPGREPGSAYGKRAFRPFLKRVD